MPRCRPPAALCAGLALVACSSWAQWTGDTTDWKEADLAQPPAFDLARLVPFDGPASSPLKFGVDPATMVIGTDGVVRYVVVITGAGGAINAMHEGIRCSTGEFKIYARYNPGSGWNRVQGAEWVSVYANMPSKHPLRLAKQGVCTNAAPASSVAAIVRSLKSPDYIPRD